MKRAGSPSLRIKKDWSPASRDPRFSRVRAFSPGVCYSFDGLFEYARTRRFPMWSFQFCSCPCVGLRKRRVEHPSATVEVQIQLAFCAPCVAAPRRLVSAMAAAHSVVAVPGAQPPKRLRGKTSPLYVSLLDAVGGEDGDARQQVYLVTVSRVRRAPAVI